MSPVWCERGYKLTSDVYQKFWRLKFFMGQDYQEIRLRLPTGRSADTHGKDCAGLVGHELLPQKVLTPKSPDLNPLEKACKECHNNTEELNTSVNRIEERLRQKGL